MTKKTRLEPRGYKFDIHTNACLWLALILCLLLFSRSTLAFNTSFESISRAKPLAVSQGLVLPVPTQSEGGFIASSSCHVGTGLLFARTTKQISNQCNAFVLSAPYYRGSGFIASSADHVGADTFFAEPNHSLSLASNTSYVLDHSINLDDQRIGTHAEEKDGEIYILSEPDKRQDKKQRQIKE